MARVLLILLASLSACGRTAIYEGVLKTDAGTQQGQASDAGTHQDAGPLEVAAELEGLRWELPCIAPYQPAPEYVCVSGPDQTTTATLTGRPGTTYEITLHVRGVVETTTYQGGMGTPISRGGTPSGDAWNIYRLDISSPAQRWFLNNGETGLYYCRVIDERFTVQADGQARFTLFASTVDGNRSEIRNRGLDGGALLVPSLSPTPFDGQFLQMDVESVRALP